MSNQINHESFSELLSGYLRDNLSADEKRAVTTHLESCSDCREELAGLRALVGGEVARLDDFERRRIHAAVAEAIEAKEEPSDETFGVWTPPRRRQGLMARFAPTMGVAALLILLAVGAFTLGGTGSDDADSGGSAIRGVRERDELQPAGGGGGEAPDPESAPDAGTEGGSTGELTSRGFDGPRPKFKRQRGHLAETFDIANAGNSLAGYVQQTALARYSEAYSVRDAEHNEGAFLRLLSWEAPRGLRDQVRDCGDRVRDVTDASILSAYGTVTQFDARKSLLLGFVYAEAPRGKLSNYMLWAWPKGSCEESTGYTEGTVDR